MLLPWGLFDLPVAVTPTLVTLLLAAALDAAPPPARTAPSPEKIQLAQVTIEQRVIIRIPMVRPPAPPMPPAPPNGRTPAAVSPRTPAPPPPLTFKEVKGPKCLQLGKLRGAFFGSNAGIVMLSANDERFRPHFSRSCRAADFYAGFYIEPNKDGSLCAGRDVFHTRNGSSCEIERFARIVPDRDDEDDED